MFGILIGFVWLATVPLTSGLVAQIFGVKALATLYGIVFLFHQIGSFLGAWIGGIVYEKTGSYDTIWIACVFLSVLAAVIHIDMDDKKIEYKSL
jgi:predicted MFS family arabinose efflux permease